MTKVEHRILVNVPVSVAYNQWTQFEDFPHFMKGIKKVTQLSDDRLGGELGPEPLPGVLGGAPVMRLQGGHRRPPGSTCASCRRGASAASSASAVHHPGPAGYAVAASPISREDER